MADIPTNEPLQLRAGTTWQWRREDLSDYPAPTWVLTYFFKNAAANFSLSAAADGANHAVTETAANSATRAAGKYTWVAIAVSGAVKAQLDEGVLEVLPDFTAAGNLDARSDARKIYEDLLAAYKTYAVSNGRIKQYTIGTRSMEFHSSEELLKQLNYWKSQVANEEAAERLRNGLGTGNKLYVRSTN